MATAAADNSGRRRLDFSSMAMATAVAADGDGGGSEWQRRRQMTVAGGGSMATAAAADGDGGGSEWQRRRQTTAAGGGWIFLQWQRGRGQQMATMRSGGDLVIRPHCQHSITRLGLRHRRR
jgi:hypothetical protein